MSDLIEEERSAQINKKQEDRELTTIVIMTEDMGRELKTFLRAMNIYLYGEECRWEVWDMSRGILDPSRAPQIRKTLYIPMISPAARSRRHENALSYASLLIEWLEAYGARIILGGSSRAVRIASCKTLQALVFIRAGFVQPPQVTVCDSELADRAARKLLRFVDSVNDPRYSKDPHSKHEGFLKPDSGSGGMHVRRFRDCSELSRLAQARPRGEAALRGAPAETYVLQRAVPGCTTVRRSGAGGFRIVRVFHRVEFANANLLYCMQAVANDDARSLCPCEDTKTQGVDWRILKSPRAEFGEGCWRAFMESCQNLMRNEPMLRTFTLKVLFDEERMQLVPVGIDCCDCPKYNIELEKRYGSPSGYQALSEVILGEIRKKTTT